MLDRALLAAGLIILGLALYWLGQRAYIGWVNRRLDNSADPKRWPEDWRPGRAGLLVFTSPDCQPCRTLQEPAVQQLAREVGPQIAISRVDVTRRPDLAELWGVLSVPSTMIVDASGQVCRVNHGYAPAHRLRAQLRTVLEGKRE